MDDIDQKIQDALDARELYNQFEISPIPGHSHNGTDSQQVDYNTLVNKPTTPFSVSNGGTGDSTLAAHGVLIGQGTSAVAVTGAGTTGQVFTSNGASADPTFQTLSLFKQFISFMFNSNRITAGTLGGGSLNYAGSFNVKLTTGAGTAASYAFAQYVLASGNTNSLIYNNNPTYGTTITIDSIDLAHSEVYVGLGSALFNNPMAFTANHVGFKIINGSMSATQGDGTTETASSTLTSVVNGDILDLLITINSSTPSYYWRKNQGAWSAATTLSTNFPSGTVNADRFTWGIDNNNSAATAAQDIFIGDSYYYR